jgi:putative membrane protein
MSRAVLFAGGLLTLAVLWLGPLPALAPHRFSAHMTMHMGVVAVAAPMISIALAGHRFDPARRAPALFRAIPASVLELIVVWGWHAPALHRFARGSTAGLLVEQATFLACGLLVWMAAFGGPPERRGGAAGTGVVALLLTSMHMTLLGAIFALSPRPLFPHAAAMPLRSPLDEQHLGGAIMLLVGGASYLAGGLWLSAQLLARPAAARPDASGHRLDGVRR